MKTCKVGEMPEYVAITHVCHTAMRLHKNINPVDASAPTRHALLPSRGSKSKDRLACRYERMNMKKT